MCVNVCLILKTIFKICTHRVIDSDKLSFLKNIVRDWPRACTFYNFIQKVFSRDFGGEDNRKVCASMDLTAFTSRPITVHFLLKM